MKNVFLFFIITLVCISCSQKENGYYLKNGLSGYKKMRSVDREFIDGYGVKKIAFFERSDTISFALLLDDTIDPKTVTNYSLGLYVYPTDKSFLENRDYLIWDSKPLIKQFGSYKYIIGDFPQLIKRIDSLSFFLYEREGGYNGVTGNLIRFKNISI